MSDEREKPATDPSGAVERAVGFLAEGGTYIDAGQTERLRIHREEGFGLTPVYLAPTDPSGVEERLEAWMVEELVDRIVPFLTEAGYPGAMSPINNIAARIQGIIGGGDG